MLFIRGHEAASALFTKKATEVQQKVRSETDQAAEDLESAMRSEIPVLEGDTRDSVSNTVEDGYGGYARRVGPTHFVARFLEYGTVNMPQKMDLHGVGRRIGERWQQRMRGAA